MHTSFSSRTSTWLFIGLAACCLSLGAQAQPKIGLVDLDKLLGSYYRTKQVMNQLKERAAGFEEDKKTMLKDLEKAQEDYKTALEATNEPGLSSDERDKRKATLEKRLLELKQIDQEITQFQRTSNVTLKEQENRMMGRILDDIREVVSLKAKEKSLTMVLESSSRSATGAPVVLYHNGENDLTDAVLAELNSRTPVELPAEKKNDKKQ